MSVCPSVQMEQLCPTGWIFMKFDVFSKNMTRLMGTSREVLGTFMTIFC
jgi:hypothetical protein